MTTASVKVSEAKAYLVGLNEETNDDQRRETLAHLRRLQMDSRCQIDNAEFVANLVSATEPNDVIGLLSWLAERLPSNENARRMFWSAVMILKAPVPVG